MNENGDGTTVTVYGRYIGDFEDYPEGTMMQVGKERDWPRFWRKRTVFWTYSEDKPTRLHRLAKLIRSWGRG